MRFRFGFTMMELIFVIVVMGILAKFGFELLAQSYHNFLFTKINNQLQADAEIAVETIASRLRYRIKASTIGRKLDGTFESIQSASGTAYPILEWIGADQESFRGVTTPYWSGIIDLDNSTGSALSSPQTNTNNVNSMIQILSHSSGTTINDAALYFIGSNSNKNQFGWNGVAITDQNHAIHPIIQDPTNTAVFKPKAGTFSGTEVYEYYKLAWSAYAVGIDDYNATGNNTGTLKLWFDYQPWAGETYSANGQSEVIMENVSTFQFRAAGDVLKIQVCVKSTLVQDETYSLCKEKTVF